MPCPDRRYLSPEGWPTCWPADALVVETPQIEVACSQKRDTCSRPANTLDRLALLIETLEQALRLAAAEWREKH